MSNEPQLARAPDSPRERELWLQHVAGYIIFEDVRRYAVDRVDPAYSAGERSAALKAIDDAVYGLMMVIDGVTGTLRSETESVNVRMHVEHRRYGEVVQDLDLFSGDGMCMGYHFWLDGDFGAIPVTQAQQ
jgi:hypothetical protein